MTNSFTRRAAKLAHMAWCADNCATLALVALVVSAIEIPYVELYFEDLERLSAT